MKRSSVVLLNGVGSVGKSAVAKALQTITRVPYLHVSMDAFLEMMPAALQDHPDGFAYEAAPGNGGPEIAIKTGPFGAQVIRAMRHGMAAMAGQGSNLIIDDVSMEGDAEYRELFSGHDFHLVGLHAPLDVLEARERARGDRAIGLARWQLSRVHRDMTYDLEIDTSRNSPLACAARIKDKFDL
jgi:chloramphenicol 3-O phosphotransferase